jgi:osmoprotectant transport system ATP-binding protein
MKPTSGEIWIGEQPLSKLTQTEIAQQIGYVIQEGGLFPHLTARQNLELATLAKSWPKDRTAHRIQELADLVQIENSALDRYAKELSGGQRQRVALMRALMLNPEIVLLDEPLGALDPLVRSDLQKELKRIFNALKKTVIIVTHDIGEGAFFGHTISLFHEGFMVQHGEFKSFVETPASDFVYKFVHAQAPTKEIIEAFQ